MQRHPDSSGLESGGASSRLVNNTNRHSSLDVFFAGVSDSNLNPRIRQRAPESLRIQAYINVQNALSGVINIKMAIFSCYLFDGLLKPGNPATQPWLESNLHSFSGHTAVSAKTDPSLEPPESMFQTSANRSTYRPQIRLEILTYRIQFAFRSHLGSATTTRRGGT